MHDIIMNMRDIYKTTSIVLFAATFLFGSAIIPYLSNVMGVASEHPGYVLQARNVSDGDNFEGSANSVTLEGGEIAQLRMQLNNLNPDNDIEKLRLKAFFNDQPNPTRFNADVKADNLDWIGGEVSVSVPNGFFLEYVSGSTVMDVDDRPEFMTRTNIPDVNGTTPLAFSNGYELAGFEGGPNSWMWFYFKVKAVANEPTVINPRLDVEKMVANTTKGENLQDKNSETAVFPGDKVTVRIVVKNAVAESTLNNVVVKDQKPQGNATPQALKVTASSKEATKRDTVTINILESQEISVISGSVVLKDLFGNTIKKLSNGEVKKLFGSGLSLGEIHGTFEYAKVIEYKAKVSSVLGPEKPPVLPDTGPSAGLLVLLGGSVPAGVLIRKFWSKI